MCCVSLSKHLPVLMPLSQKHTCTHAQTHSHTVCDQACKTRQNFLRAMFNTTFGWRAALCTVTGHTCSVPSMVKTKVYRTASGCMSNSADCASVNAYTAIALLPHQPERWLTELEQFALQQVRGRREFIKPFEQRVSIEMSCAQHVKKDGVHQNSSP